MPFCDGEQRQLKDEEWDHDPHWGVLHVRAPNGDSLTDKHTLSGDSRSLVRLITTSDRTRTG